MLLPQTNPPHFRGLTTILNTQPSSLSWPRTLMPQHAGSSKLGCSQGQPEGALRCPKAPSAGGVVLEAVARGDGRHGGGGPLVPLPGLLPDVAKQKPWNAPSLGTWGPLPNPCSDGGVPAPSSRRGDKA